MEMEFVSAVLFFKHLSVQQLQIYRSSTDILRVNTMAGSSFHREIVGLSSEHIDFQRKAFDIAPKLSNLTLLKYASCQRQNPKL